jgi:hypothetical protein
MKKHRKMEYVDLRAELDALRQQVHVLETAQARGRNSAQRRHRFGAPKQILMVALPVAGWTKYTERRTAPSPGYVPRSSTPSG